MTIVRDVLAHDPLSGHFYVFFTRRCDGVRIVYWDRDGTDRTFKGEIPR